VSCAFSKETLALHVEGDLSHADATVTSRHLTACGDCRRFFEQLRDRQSLLKSLRREMVSPSECTGMRREVMSMINDRQARAGWVLGIERAIVLGFRRRSYALAALGLFGLVSVSMLAHMRNATTSHNESQALFEGREILRRPEGYQGWILIGGPEGPRRSGVDDDSASTTTPRPARNVYINPSGYREYVKTGKFPEGTLMVWESANREADTANPHTQTAVLLASVKDSARFDGGWGFFDFTGIDGTVTSKAQALPESSGCRACHRQHAETDHVFTQFYPVLRSARLESQGAQLAVPRERARVANT
jgi:hypothetical protein